MLFPPRCKNAYHQDGEQGEICFPLPNASEQGEPAGGRPLPVFPDHTLMFPLSVEMVVMVQPKILPSARQWKRTIKGLHSAPPLLFTCRMGVS